MRLLETFANHASASLENARLISRLRRHAEDSEHQALHDALTGLPNRAMFREQVEGAVRRSTGTGFAVLIMDLDKFKEVNDTLGHQNGDRILVAAADRLLASVRPGDIVARLGGDEFGVLLEDVTDADDALGARPAPDRRPRRAVHCPGPSTRGLREHRHRALPRSRARRRHPRATR